MKVELVEGEPETVYERYELPVSPGDIDGTLPPPPWIRRFFGLGADEVARLLADDWSGFRHPSLRNFRDAVFAYSPFALVHDNRRWRLGMRRGPIKRGNSTFGRTHVYIERSSDLAALRSVLASHGLEHDDLILEFYTYFYGFSYEPIDYIYNGFVRPDEWESFESYGWDDALREFDHDGKWRRSLIICHWGSEMTLLDPISGETAWAVYTTRPAIGPFVPLAPSFASLLDTIASDASQAPIGLSYYDWRDR